MTKKLTPRSGRSEPRRGPRPLTRAKRRVFWILLVVMTLLPLVLAEVVCRARGFGGHPPVIARVGDDAGRTWYTTQRRGTDIYFSRGRRAPGGGMREIQFASPKPPGSVRIVLLGESAIQGFPQSLPLTDGEFLATQLREVWGPSRPVEVLNLGATAVASFPVRRFLDEAIERAQPDLVVIMVGNNEFYGAYGLASLPRPAWSPAGMRVLHELRGLGIVQGLAAFAERRSASGAPLMERAGAGRSILAEDPRRAAAARSLETHLGEMVQRCVAARVPVIVCTAPTNERGLAPIGVDPEPRLPEGERAAFHADLDAAEGALERDPAAAAEHARAALGADSTQAYAHYVLAQALARLGNDAEALHEYVRARDLDPMPWRATSAAQQAARTAAARGAVFCDMEAAFRAASPGGAIGWELLDDHVHFSLQGQVLFARSLAATMTALPEPLHVDATALAALPDWEIYAQRAGRSIFSDFTAVSHLRKLFSIDFMRRNNEAAYRRFEALSAELLARMSALDRSAVERWNDPSLHGASERPLESVVGAYRMGAGDYELAANLLRVAHQSVPDISLWRLEITWALLTCSRHLRAAPAPEDVALCHDMIRTGELLRRYGGGTDIDVLRYLGLAYNMAGDFSTAVARLEPVVGRIAGQEGWEVVSTLADSYLQLGRPGQARDLLQRAATDPQMAPAAQRMLDRLAAPSR